MGNAMVWPAKSRDPETQFFFGTVAVGSSGAVSSQTSNGFTIAITGTTGEYTITMDDPYPELLFVGITPIAATEEVSTWRVDSHAISSTGVITIGHTSQSTATQVAAWPSSGNSYQVMVVVKNSSVTP